ncbi:MAG: CvpA family protein [Bacillota bacterium]
MNWLDLLLLVLFLRAAAIGYHRGFLRTSLGLLSLAVGFWTAARYCEPCGQFLDQKFDFSQRLGNWIGEHLNWTHPAAGIDLQDFPAQFLPAVAQEVPLPEYYQDLLSFCMVDIASYSNQMVFATVGSLLSQALASLIKDGLIFLILAVGITLGLRLIGSLLIFWRQGRVGLIDRLAGTLFSLTSQGLIFTLLFGLFMLIWPVLGLLGNQINSGIIKGLGSALETSQLAPHFGSLFVQITQWLFKY